ncbi:glutathione peroxidase [Vagococcus teuberi]|uniref:Glutathione peroxidase n=1 Tax=Vagococcus teuberi TaxID=519472 RepID=A0A1J0A372_9ENTE|nr:glutathione peroxidase [Vagococcus teuberi]APB30369.1 glutathione peroxidase [Vagococcus teuberi]
MTIYDYIATLDSGETYSMERYKGKVMVIVNTATKCGLASQFKELEEIYQTYKNQDVIVLGFPSDQFHQELKDSQKASQTCRMTYGVSFPMHEISKVNGAYANPIFDYLVEGTFGFLGNKIKWNFTKFLVDKNGNVVKRFAPTDKPEKMIPYINSLLEE